MRDILPVRNTRFSEIRAKSILSRDSELRINIRIPKLWLTNPIAISLPNHALVDASELA
jgi:hypothetical protein